MTARYKFYATGKVLCIQKSISSGKTKNVFHDFSRVVYAETWRDVMEMINEQMKAKYGKDTKIYETVSCDVLIVNIFKEEWEEYDWDAHRRAGLPE